jgi:hypothetical protein
MSKHAQTHASKQIGNQMREEETPYPGRGACELCGAVDPCTGCVSPEQVLNVKQTLTSVSKSLYRAVKSANPLDQGDMKKINSVLASIIKR